jgi:predicted CXXCH cytochrome family protein
MTVRKPDISLKDHSHEALSLPAFILTLFFVFSVNEAAFGEIDCRKCHGDLVREKVVHPAVQMGCPICHSGIDATVIPHKKTNKIYVGLSSATPDLCYNCHDKGSFTGKKVVHPPVAAGQCIICHSPHQSDESYLLRGKIPALCYQCHDKKKFSSKYVHAPVASGQCMSCHLPHEADITFLLRNEINKVCLGCHKDVGRQPHVEEYLGGKGHPLETRTEVVVGGKKIKLSCISCHRPHSSPWEKLSQFAPPICEKCHKI